MLRQLDARIAETLSRKGSAAAPLPGMTVSGARLAYLDVCGCCYRVTHMFQSQLFINILGNVFGVTFLTLTAFNAVMSGGSDAVRVALYLLYDSVLRTVQMYCIMDACHETVRQVRIVSLGLVRRRVRKKYTTGHGRRSRGLEGASPKSI